MIENRLHIPNKLQRELFIESGYMCAICKATSPLQIEHIVEYHKNKNHSFDNMIVLCANCHARKVNSSDPRHINTASLKKIKEGLIFLNGRYTDLEKRFIRECQILLEIKPEYIPEIFIHHTMYLQMKYIIDDGYVDAIPISGGMEVQDSLGNTIYNDQIKLILSQNGKDFVLGLTS